MERSSAVLLSVLVALTLAAPVLGAELARFQGENMNYGTWGDEPFDPSAENGYTLRFEDAGTATKQVKLNDPANAVVVRSRNAPASTGSVTINLVVDGVARTMKTILPTEAGKTYVSRSWPVNLGPGFHTIGVKGGDVAGVDKLLVDSVRLTGPQPEPVVGVGQGKPSHCTAVVRAGGSVQGAYDRARPGDVVCLRGGLHTDSVGVDGQIIIDKNNPAASPVTIKSYPGERARVNAMFDVLDGSNHNIVRDVFVDGTHAPRAKCCSNKGNEMTLPSVRILGDNFELRNSDITKRNSDPNVDPTRLGVNIRLGVDGIGIAARNIAIEHNRIHNGGVPFDETWGRVTGPDEHNIYVSRGSAITIRDNLIYGGGERGVQLYPNAHEVIVTGNVIDDNGQGLVFDGPTSNNEVRGNVISHSNVSYGVYTGSRYRGSGNLVQDNCLYQGSGDAGIESFSIGNVTVRDNVTAKPSYANPPWNYKIQNSACSAKYSGTLAK